MSTFPRLTRREFQAGAGSLLLGGALVVPLTPASVGAENGQERTAGGRGRRGLRLPTLVHDVGFPVSSGPATARTPQHPAR